MVVYSVEDIAKIAESEGYSVHRRNTLNGHTNAIIFGENCSPDQVDFQYEIIRNLKPAGIVHWRCSQGLALFQRLENDLDVKLFPAQPSEEDLGKILANPPEDFSLFLALYSKGSEDERVLMAEDCYFSKVIETAVDYAVTTNRFHVPVVAVLPSRSLRENSFLYEMLAPAIHRDDPRSAYSTGFLAINQAVEKPEHVHHDECARQDL